MSERLNRLQDIPRPIVAAATTYAPGHETPWHDHPRAQLVHAISGVMAVTTEMGVWVVPPERAVWMPAGVPHHVRFQGTVEMRSLFIDERARGGLPRGCCVITVSPLLRELIKQAAALPEEYAEDGPDGRLMAVLLDQLTVLQETPLHLPRPLDPRLIRLTDALTQDPARDDTLDDWAKEAGASARTLARLFKRETGMTFGLWRQQARLLKALELLAAGHSVTATALDLGYDSPAAFTAMFRRTLGVPPGRYFPKKTFKQ